MKLVNKWLIVTKQSISNSWGTYLAVDLEFDSGENAIEYLKGVASSIRDQYYIIKVVRYE